MFIISNLYNFITVFTLFFMLAGPALSMPLARVFSKKLALRWTNYVTHTMAHKIFNFMHVYMRINYSFDKKSKSMLPEQFILISNHQSLTDIPVYMNYFPEKEIRFVAKDALGKNIPLISDILRVQKHCLIPRSGGASIAMKTLSKFGKQVMENNQIPVIFPEGTRSKDGQLGKFYSAGFRMISDSTHLPVAVCVLDEGYKVNDLKHIWENLKNINYKVKILKVFDPPKNKEEQIKILDESHQLMQAQLEEWHKK